MLWGFGSALSMPSYEQKNGGGRICIRGVESPAPPLLSFVVELAARGGRRCAVLGSADVWVCRLFFSAQIACFPSFPFSSSCR